ncbi:hypothetical protein MM239_19020 [Belliella sp. DSM 111904]|uniref:Uncharacterized protein n=1 Tax=Belliella filtrata TaxID=2923435 RepID=A0ABS9V6C4_9BACT|nr:hypothetical protein [Belliella filtrata]MCH7411488.1 hypothetical protein [Belliella filtrata]
MKKAILLISFLISSLSVQAQHYDVKLFDGRIKQAGVKTDKMKQEYRQVQREYKKYVKDRKKQYHAKKDSLGNYDSLKNVISTDSIKRLIRLREEQFVFADSLYSLEQIASWDKAELNLKNQSILRTKERLEGRGYFSKYEALEGQIASHRRIIKEYKDSLSTIDSLDRDEINFRVKQKKEELSGAYESKLEAITGEIVNDKMPELPGGFQNKELQKFQNKHAQLKGNFDDQGLLLLSEAQAVDHFAGKEQVLQAAQEKVAVLKKKYSEVLDAEDLSTATKINSLKGEPIRNRLVYGGTLQLHVDRSTNLDLNPEISYRMKKDLEFGLGGTYRLNVQTKDLPNAIKQPNVLGYRGFVNQKVFKSLYVHGEYESLSNTLMTKDRQLDNIWYGSFLGGLQKRFRLKGKSYGQVLLLYNFHYRENPMYNSPWVFRVGFEVSNSR